jgi:Kef-type K+ transport system membrane component KefB
MEEITEILFDLFIIFALAKVAGEVFTRIRQPAIVGEVLVGIVIGPHALGLVGKPDADLITLFSNDEEAAREALNIVFDVIAELGVILLLFFVGLETRLGELMDVRGRAVGVGVLASSSRSPWASAHLRHRPGDVESAFVATAMVATSVGITARV